MANGMVLSVNELVDGSAASTVDDISKQFERIREVASLCSLPNPNCINWTLVKSSSSDSDLILLKIEILKIIIGNP